MTPDRSSKFARNYGGLCTLPQPLTLTEDHDENTDQHLFR